jgi:hypothetical protein
MDLDVEKIDVPRDDVDEASKPVRRTDSPEASVSKPPEIGTGEVKIPESSGGGALDTGMP